LSQYRGEVDHGYWWLHANGTLQHCTNCHGMEPEEFFQNWTTIDWWHVRCELDWYRMKKQSDILREGPIVPTWA